MKIEVLTNEDKRFYPLVGPFLSRREIVAEQGAPIWDDDGKLWFVATERGKVLGFSAIQEKKGGVAEFVSDYCVRSCEHAYFPLVEAQLEFLRQERWPGIVRVVAREKDKLAFLREAGFVSKGKRGSFERMELRKKL